MKRVCYWEPMQIGFNVAKLKIRLNHCIRKKHALDALHATNKYKSMTSAVREQADTTVIIDYKTHRDADLAAVAWQWKHLNLISDHSNDDSQNDSNNDSGDGSDDDNATDLDWNSLDENEANSSDPEYEVNETAAVQKGIPYELNEDGKVKLDEKTTAGL